MVCLVLLPGLRADNVDVDSLDYRNWFDLAVAGSVGIENWLREPAFFSISSLVASLGIAYFGVQLIYAFLALTAKLYFTVYAVPNRWLTLYFYLLFCRFYLIQEFAEIRAGVAIALMSVSIYLLCSGKRKSAIALFLVASTFHWSVLVALPVFILLLAGVKFYSRLWVTLFLPITCIALVGLHVIINALSFIYRLSRYYADPHAADGLNALGLHFIMHIVVVAWVVCFYWKRLSLLQRVATVCTSLGIFLFVTFIQLSAVAYRFEDVFDLFWVLLIIAVLQFSSGMKRLAYILVLVVAGFGLFYVSVAYKYVGPYATVLSH
jgi:hypothetical protein